MKDNRCEIVVLAQCLTIPNLSELTRPGPEVMKNNFMLNSAEPEILVTKMNEKSSLSH